MPRIYAPTPGAIASAVWTAATRTLTADPTPFTAIGARVSVATGAILDLRPGAGKFRLVTVGATFTVNELSDTGVYDGTNFEQMDTGTAASLQIRGSGFGNATRGISFRNSGLTAQTAHYAGFDRG